MEQLSLFDINFPIFSVSKTYKRIWEEFNVTYIETVKGVYVLDNKNIPGDTIGERRLKINNSKLYNFKKSYYTISQMLHSKYNVFVDVYGTVFKYKKTKMVPLIYYKVENISKASDGECVLSIPSINYYYKVTCRNAYGINYIGLLVTHNGYILYDLSEYKKNNSRRKI